MKSPNDPNPVLLLLEADPLEKIENTKRICAVVLGGKLLSKQQIDEMLANFEKIANQKPISKLLMKTIQEQDVAAAIKQYYDLKSRDPETYGFSESELCSCRIPRSRPRKFPSAPYLAGASLLMR